MKNWKFDSIDEFYKNVIYFNFNEKQINDYYNKKIIIPKKNGVREIYIADKSKLLYLAQKTLKHNFLDNILLSDCVYGFVPGRNYFDYLFEHICVNKERYYMRIDIKKFFNSITSEQIEETFSFYAEGIDKKKIIQEIKSLCLYKNELVQGTPVAPIISNIVFRELDIRIERYCDQCGIVYTRYADDLLFSTEKKGILNKRFIRTIARILKTKQFYINYSKLQFSQKSIALNGYVISKDVRLSRKKLKSISRIVFNLETIKAKNRNENLYYNHKNDVINYLAGSRSFILLALKYAKNEEYINHCLKLIKRIQKQIDKLEEL